MAANTKQDVVSIAEAVIQDDVLARRIPLAELRINASYSRTSWLTQGWTRQYRLTKRFFDIATSVLFLMCLAPFLPVITLLIKLDSPGPVLYSQERIGLSGRRFRIYKFRSMRQDAEALGAVYASENDPRVTRVGRWLRRTRVDEVPQLWNVLRGEMAIIGPRPERPENEEMLEKGIPGFSLRTCVKPGLTGWAQICAPYANTIEQSGRKLEYDLYYIRHASITMDVRIAWRTVLVMLRLAGQ